MRQGFRSAQHGLDEADPEPNSVLLRILVIVIDRSFPRNYYCDQLTYARARLMDQGMAIVPELIGRVLSVTALAGNAN